MNRHYHFGICHYCICTACSRFKCPFEFRTFQECYACRERRENRPRLDCDYFCHYLKKHHFRFKRVIAPLPPHFGTYILMSSSSYYVGPYDKLLNLQKLFGGTLKPLNIIDYNLLKGE